MKKTLSLLAVVLVLSSCATGSGNEQITAMQNAVVQTMLDTECHNQINNQKTWQMVSIIFTPEKKASLENEVCSCVSEQTSKNLTLSDSVALLNPATRASTAAKLASQTLGVCVKQLTSSVIQTQ